MANFQELQVYGTQLLFADHATDFGAAPATAANSLIIGTPTDVQIDLTGVAAAAARQSAKTSDLGEAWSNKFWAEACMENETAPAAGGTFDFYWNSSPSATAATGNKGGVSGSDAAYTSGSNEEDQLHFIGFLVVKNTVINIGDIGFMYPRHRYGSLIVINNTSTALRSTATAMDETHITLTPLISEYRLV